MLAAAWAMEKALVWALENSGSDRAYSRGDDDDHGEGGVDATGVRAEVGEEVGYGDGPKVGPQV